MQPGYHSKMLVAVLLSLLIQQPPPKRPVQLPGTYAHPFHAYKILLPTGWARGPTHAQAQASFYAPRIEAYVPRADLHIVKGVKEFGAYTGKFRDSLRAAYPDTRFDGDELSSVHGRTALYLVVSFTDGGIAMKSIWMSVMRDDRVYQLGWACTAAFFKRFEADIEAMFKSLRIYAEPAVPREKAERFLKLYHEGEALYREQNFAGAGDRFAEAAEILPDYPEIHATIGTTCMRRRDFPAAEAAYRKAQELDPEDASHAFNFGMALLQQQKYGPAIEALTRATKAEPWMEPAWTNLGAAHFAKQQYAPAAAALEKAVAADPESVAAHFNLGLAYEQLGQPAKAAAQFRETLKLAPQHEGARDGLKRLK